MKATETQSKASSSPRRYKYTKVLDNRKHPIRGLWRRNGKFIARLSVEGENGKKGVKWIPLHAATLGEAQAELRTVFVERKENRLRHIGRSPTFGKYLEETFLPLLDCSGKKPDTIVTEKGHYNRWKQELGMLHLDKIRPSHILTALKKLKATRSARTCNLALVCLRHVLRAAKRDRFLKTLPTDEIEWFRTEKKSRTLFTVADLETVLRCAVRPMERNVLLETGDVVRAGTSLKNGKQFSDYLRFLAYSGAREQEALKIRWEDVNFDRQFVTIGAEGDTKNRESRTVDFNPNLETHLQGMYSCRAPDSKWMFPSPQRGERDQHALTFRETLKIVRQVAGFPKFGFHDVRHHFISYCVMSGIDFMTIARWVGHKDGGVLIGKVYGHLSNEHAKLQASKVVFEPRAVVGG